MLQSISVSVYNMNRLIRLVGNLRFTIGRTSFENYLRCNIHIWTHTRSFEHIEQTNHKTTIALRARKVSNSHICAPFDEYRGQYTFVFTLFNVSDPGARNVIQYIIVVLPLSPERKQVRLLLPYHRHTPGGRGVRSTSPVTPVIRKTRMKRGPWRGCVLSVYMFNCA